MHGIDFLRDARSEIIKWLPFDQTSAATKAFLETVPDVDLYVIFFNWLARLIHIHPREPHLSKEYVSRSTPVGLRAKVLRVTEKIREGEDLNGHLSKRVQTGFDLQGYNNSASGFNRREDLDLLLNDWGVHHLHVSDNVESDGFVTRDGPLLFVIFTQADAYILDVIDHGNWTDQHVVEIAVRNWPGAGLFHEFIGVTGMEGSISTADRRQLRHAGIDCPIEVDGKVYLSAARGLSTAGTSGAAGQRALWLQKSLSALQYRLLEGPGFLIDTFRAADLPCSDNPCFRLLLANSPAGFHFVIVEEKAGGLMRVE